MYSWWWTFTMERSARVEVLPEQSGGGRLPDQQHFLFLHYVNMAYYWPPNNSIQLAWPSYALPRDYHLPTVLVWTWSHWARCHPISKQRGVLNAELECYKSTQAQSNPRADQIFLNLNTSSKQMLVTTELPDPLYETRWGNAGLCQFLSFLGK